MYTLYYSPSACSLATQVVLHELDQLNLSSCVVNTKFVGERGQEKQGRGEDGAAREREEGAHKHHADPAAFPMAGAQA